MRDDPLPLPMRLGLLLDDLERQDDDASRLFRTELRLVGRILAGVLDGPLDPALIDALRGHLPGARAMAPRSGVMAGDPDRCRCGRELKKAGN